MGHRFPKTSIIGGIVFDLLVTLGFFFLKELRGMELRVSRPLV